VAEGARLESVYRLIPYRGFESPSLRHCCFLFELGLRQDSNDGQGVMERGLSSPLSTEVAMQIASGAEAPRSVPFL
jgi:hypothetical protein